MLTYRATNCETITKDVVSVGGHEVRATWRDQGPVVNQADIRAIRDSGHANWSDDEIGRLARHCEEKLAEVYERQYSIAYVKADGGFDVADTFRAIDDAAANAYAEANYSGEWYVLSAIATWSHYPILAPADRPTV